MSIPMSIEYLKCLVCNETPNSERVKALRAAATSYDSNPFDPKDPVIVSETEVYCCTDCYMRGVVTQEDALDESWSRTVFYM
jgi:hypothetical protein